jgi:peptidoglycan hydrolase-like protein with peptidoglycan-binding domain
LDNEKQLARQRREKRFRRRITTLSWAVPVFAFGGFFSVWHSISSAVNSPVQSKASVSATSNQPKPAAIVLFKTGTRNPQVRTIQEQLYELGYFNHAITDYYGPVTAGAVQSFQTTEHLNPTGEVDNTTLVSLQQAVKNQQMAGLTSPSKSVTSEQTSDTTGTVSTQRVASTSSSSTKKSMQAISRKPAPATAPTTRSTTVSGQGSQQSSATVSSQSSPQTRSSAS